MHRLPRPGTGSICGRHRGAHISNGRGASCTKIFQSYTSITLTKPCRTHAREPELERETHPRFKQIPRLRVEPRRPPHTFDSYNCPSVDLGAFTNFRQVHTCGCKLDVYIYAKVRASLATALLRGKSIHPLYESLWFAPCLLAVCLLLKRFFSSLARFAGSSATLTLRKNICWFFSWLVIGEGPELLDAESHSSIAPLRRGTCRRSKSQSL